MGRATVETTDMVRHFKRVQFDGQLIDRDHAEFDRYRRVWNATADRRPGVIVRAGSVKDIQKVITAAAQDRTLLAVRGGGHSIPGLSTCDDGIMLDLSLMNSVSIDKSSGRAEAQGGALLGDLDRAAVEHGRVVPAGVISHTGVAGLTLGGGMGWLSRHFGLTIDSLLAADIITADGQLLHVSDKSEPELFWAIRGGGGNFGVVSRFVFRTHHLGPVLIGKWTYPVTQAGAVLRQLNDLAAHAPRELTTGFVFLAAGLNVTAIWSGAAEEADDQVMPFGRLGQPETSSVGEITFLQLQSMADERMAWDRRFYAKGGFVREIDAAVIDRMVDCIANSPAADAEFYVIQLGGAVCDVADNDTPYSGRQAGFYWLVESAWDDPAEDERVISWSRAAAASLAEVSMRGNYVNEQIDVSSEVARSAYGETKYDRLSKLKARYDPTNLFRLNQNIEPKF